ncbi:MAG TPA: enoyl-CoA hydratase-related protein [Sphingobium sp.]
MAHDSHIGRAESPVLLERRGAIAHLTLNSPERGNTIDVAMARALLDAAITCDDDPAIRCVIIRGKGLMFCAGGDVAALHAAGDALPDLLAQITDHLHAAILRLAKLEKPVITAIHGATAGAGVALAAIGDIAIAEPAAHFTLAYARIGLSPDGGATWLLPRLIGLRRTQELAMTNRRISAEEAALIGLVTKIVPQGELASEVETLAQNLAHAAVGALGRTKRLLLDGAETSFDDQLDAESRSIVAQGASIESRQGIKAFAERRQPVFLDTDHSI